MKTQTLGIPASLRPFVALIGEDGNAFAIMGNVTKALTRAGFAREVIEEYLKRATAADDYDHLLRITLEYVKSNKSM